MIFAKIDFINLLPFYIYLKKHLNSSQQKQIIEYKKSYPADINKKFLKAQVDGAFISSIKSQKCKCLKVGIVAKKEVYSVISIKGENKTDYQSDTSNVLAQVLQIKGQVLIGDKALTFFHNNKKEDFIDLAKEWHDRYKLPFVFARLCVNKKDKSFEKLVHNFTKTKVKIPQYILKKYAKRANLTNKQILEYLDKISYSINHKEQQSLKKFFKLAKEIHGDI